MRLLFALFLVMPCWANFLLEYYDPSGATDFSTLVSITDPNSETTQYLLTGEGVNQWPGWVSDAQEPDWAKISYGAPQDMTYQQGECAEGGVECGNVTYTVSTVTVQFSAGLTNGGEFLWVDPPGVGGVPGSVPEPSTWVMIAGGLLGYSIRRKFKYGKNP